MLQETLAEKIPIWQNDLKQVLDQNGDKVISSVTISQAIKGMRGVKSLICDTSTVSADKGLMIRGHSILDITNILPEEAFYLLLTGDLPNKNQLSDLQNQLNDYLSKASIITLDAGNHTGWPQRFVKFHKDCLQIGTTCGSMGYSIPAAIAASLEFPNKQVVSFVGDGGFLMSGLEISTAVQNGLGIIIIIFNNSSYGTIRMHQEKYYPKRVVGTDLKNPDFVSFSKSMGANAKRVKRVDDFFLVFKRYLK